MSDRTDTRDAILTEGGAPFDKELEDVVGETFDEASTEEAEDLEEAIEESLVEEEEEEEAEEADRVEAAIEAELDIEDQAAVEEAAVLDVLLRRSGVLPRETDQRVLDEETELPPARRADEFVCSSCFLIKPRSQLGDAAHQVCRDCLDPPNSHRHVA